MTAEHVAAALEKQHRVTVAASDLHLTSVASFGHFVVPLDMGRYERCDIALHCCSTMT